MRISHDDNLLDVIDKVNAELAAHGLSFVDDGKEHDGWNECELKRTGPCNGFPHRWQAAATQTEAFEVCLICSLRREVQR